MNFILRLSSEANQGTKLSPAYLYTLAKKPFKTGPPGNILQVCSESVQTQS